VVGDGRDHGGLARARRAVEQVPPLPWLAGAPVEVPVVPERVEVVHDLLLLGRVHGQRLERRRVVEVDEAPRVVVVVARVLRDPVVAVQPAAAVAEEDLAASPADVRQVLVDHEPAVAFVEREALHLAPAAAVLRPLDPLRRRLVRHGRPHERGAPELVGHVLAVAHADDEAVALLGALGAELAGVLRARGAQVRLHLLEGAVARARGLFPQGPRVGGWLLRDVEVHVGIDDGEDAACVAPEEDVEVGQEQPPRRVRRQQRRQEEPRRGEVGQHPLPQPRHRARLPRDSHGRPRSCACRCC